MKIARRRLLALFFSAAVLLALPRAVSATGDVSTEFHSRYDVQSDISTENGVQTAVSHDIVLTNRTANSFASRYRMTFGSTDIRNIRASDTAGPLPVTIDQDENSVTIHVNLEARPVVGAGARHEFRIQYITNDIATSVGRVLELNIPRVANSNEFSRYGVVVSVPKKFGSPNSMVPEAASVTETGATREVSFDQLGNSSGITAVFGTTQAFRVRTSYYLRNRSSNSAIQTVALVPDTSYQRVSYRSIDPPPVQIDRDDDGNWLARYRLDAGQELAITADLDVQLFLDPRPLDQREPSPNDLAATSVWQSSDPELRRLAEKLNTPREIYQFVVDTLSYNYERATNGAERMGAIAALAQTDQAICTDFTDVFIALARAAGIPARELNGYAYTQNSKLRPLSLQKDILHAWPEYWDSSTKKWIAIDPTWADTTGGIDYFSKLDLSHIVFAIHGSSPTSPLPAGFYKTSADQGKTVLVEPSAVDVQLAGDFSISPTIPQAIQAWRKTPIGVSIENKTGQAIYRLPIRIMSSYTIVESAPERLAVLLPWQTARVHFSLKPHAFWKPEPGNLTIAVGNSTTSYDLASFPLYASAGFLAVAGSLVGTILIAIAVRASRRRL